MKNIIIIISYYNSETTHNNNITYTMVMNHNLKACPSSTHDVYLTGHMSFFTVTINWNEGRITCVWSSLSTKE